MTALVVFDIEAVPDLEVGRRLLGQPGDATDADVRRILGERYAREGRDSTTAFLKTPLYRIVSIAALYAKREEGGGPWTITQIGRWPRRACCSALSKASIVAGRAHSCDL
jgi:hypothetical protein